MGLGSLDDGLARTPPMGWNSWNRFGCDINEKLIRETVDAMAANGMRDAGYEYVVIDDCWHAFERDGRGSLQSNSATFPSGIAALAKYVHSKGLKFGIYTDAGLATCQGFPGSFGREEQDAAQFAAWGVDYVKIDWCHTQGLDAKVQYGKWSEALLTAGRPMVLSICEWGVSRPWEWALVVGHLWRTTGDIQDSWESMLSILDKQCDLYPYAGPGHWNDPDMLEVGNGGMTESECRAHFSLWCIMAAPLMAGNDVRNMSEAARRMLSAPEIISVDQDPAGRQGRRIRKAGGTEVWIKRLSQENALAVALFNRSASGAKVSIFWKETGLGPGPVLVRDLWERKDLGLFHDSYSAVVPSHDVVMVKAARMSDAYL